TMYVATSESRRGNSVLWSRREETERRHMIAVSLIWRSAVDTAWLNDLLGTQLPSHPASSKRLPTPMLFRNVLFASENSALYTLKLGEPPVSPGIRSHARAPRRLGISPAVSPLCQISLFWQSALGTR